MSVARFLVGDVRDRLAEIPDGSVDLLMTSPAARAEGGVT